MSRYVVRYGSLRALGLFTARQGESYRRGMSVVARTNRGLENGQVLCEATEDVLSGLDQAPNGQILREMTDDDLNEVAHLHGERNEKMRVCQTHIDRLALDMQLVELEHLFGGERIVVYFLSENRIDFRELVKALAADFQTRIEMRQIGVRDEARLLADYGDCGKPVCCNTHLSSMPPVSMRMAKLQKATLDPTKISGRCGRLKCCLRYEYETYEELLAELPPPGARIVTRDGKATVIGHEILAQQLLVETEDNRRMLIAAADVLSVTRPPGGGSSRSRNAGDDRTE
jgi:cell fate regulator YaaT (PSP1 superfamily)